MRPISNETSVRRPAVAGLFYPAEATELRAFVSELLRQGSGPAALAPAKAFIVPHAGYVYSGIIAASAYAHVAAQRGTVRRIVLVGPSHRTYLRGACAPGADAFETPLGEIPVDRELRQTLLRRGDVLQSDQPHATEHCLEVQLPFLQLALSRFTLLPLLFGDASVEYVASVLEEVWGERDTLILASSDLSHYRAYKAAEQIDAATSAAILALEPTLGSDQACGAVAVNGLLRAAMRRGLQATELARCNSGDTAGDRTRVVGYGAFAFHHASFDGGKGGSA
ncbi:MAG TPA: AmmeMemoRadiSam system protein B [Steroidobacter sp.]|nr:AmmeMemoRadiSam system protein B [Steroidobacter sp.]